MPFQAVAWAWQIPVATAEERLALMWLSNNADPWNGLAFDFPIAQLAEFVFVSPERVLEILDDLQHLGAVRGYIVHQPTASVNLEFPVMDWDTEGPIVNRTPLPDKLRREVAHRAACFACGSRFSVQADHIFPRAGGGTNDRSNLQPLCADCNGRKSARTGWWAL